MSYTQFKDDIRVIVYPRQEGDFGSVFISGVGTPESRERHAESEANRIVAEIKRHVDDVSQAFVQYERKIRCPHCESEESISQLGQWPNCCTAQQLEFFAEHAGESDEWFFESGMDDPEYLDELRADAQEGQRPEGGEQ